MSTVTTNYGLTKDGTNENYDVTKVNANMDKIDTQMKVNADALVAHSADDMKHIDYATASGTNTYTATIANITALTEGMSIKIKFTNANTGSSTLNINSLGAKWIIKGNGNALSSGNIKAGQICHLVYAGTVFQLLGEGGEYGTAGVGDVRSTKTIGTENGVVQGTLDLTNLLSANILKDIVIAGITGSAKRQTPGTTTTDSSGKLTVTGLTFMPSLIVWYDPSTYMMGFYDANNPATKYANTINVTTAASNGLSLKSGATISSTGFVVTTQQTSTSMVWRAFE